MCTVNATIESEDKWAEEKLSKCEGKALEISAVLGNLMSKIGHDDFEKKKEVNRNY